MITSVSRGETDQLFYQFLSQVMLLGARIFSRFLSAAAQSESFVISLILKQEGAINFLLFLFGSIDRLPVTKMAFSSLRSLTKSLPSLQRTSVQTRRFFSEDGSMPHPLFSRKLLREDVWMIEEKYFVSWNRANIFFIRGSGADLVVDAGDGSIKNV